MKLRQRSKSRKRQEVPSPNEGPSAPVRPLLVLLDNTVQTPVESIIDLGENFLRPKTSPVHKHVSDPERQNPLMTMLNKHSPRSNHSSRSAQSKSGSAAFLPLLTASSTRKFEQGRLIPPTTAAQKTSNLDALYRMALQNQTAYKSIVETRIEKRKLLDREFTTQHRALKGTIRSTGLVK